MMSVLETHSCQHSYKRLKYIFNEPAHSYRKTSQRVLACTGFNIRMLHDQQGRISTIQNGAYLERQFMTNLQQAHNPQRRYQAQSVIVSFDTTEFDTSNLQQQSQQALQLVQKYVQNHFADTQAVIAIQGDGDGGKLHAHILINTVKPNGKTVPTHRFNIHKIRKDFDQTMQTNFQHITGRSWSDPVHNNLNHRQDQNNLTNRSAWQKSLKKLIKQIKREATSIKTFLNQLSEHGVTVTERQHGQAWTYHQIIKMKRGTTKELKVRDFYQRMDKRTGEVKATRGLGQEFTKSAIERYFQPNQQEETEENNNDDGFIKLKTMAADARFRARQKQSINQLNRQRLQAAEAAEQKQRAQRQARATQRKRCKERRFEEFSQQRRRRTVARRRQSEQRASQKSTDGPEL